MVLFPGKCEQVLWSYLENKSKQSLKYFSAKNFEKCSMGLQKIWEQASDKVLFWTQLPVLF